MTDAVVPMTVLVPRLVDAANVNAQNLNAKALLARFRRPGLTWIALHYGEPDSEVAHNPQVRLVRLWRRHLWPWHVVSCYLRTVDAIFYPGVEWFDGLGLRLRSGLGKRVEVIATLEGLVGDSETEARLGRLAGHPVHCHRVDPDRARTAQDVIRYADHVIAVSPFLAKMGETIFGSKFATLPLGVDSSIFFPPVEPSHNERPIVVSAGRVAAHKRPQLFLDLAAAFPQALFAWYGDGDQRDTLIARSRDLGLRNVEFLGALDPQGLARAFRKADIFVMPSWAEGAPKVIQEAAACGLPVVAFGFFEPDSVIDGESGYVVWGDEELTHRLSQLLGDLPLRRELGRRGSQLASTRTWNRLAPLWEAHIATCL